MSDPNDIKKMSDNYDYSTKGAAGINSWDCDAIVAQKIYDLQNPTINNTNPNQPTDGGVSYSGSGGGTWMLWVLGFIIFTVITVNFIAPPLQQWSAERNQRIFLNNYKVVKKVDLWEVKMDYYTWQSFYKDIFSQRDVDRIKKSCTSCQHSEQFSLDSLRMDAIKMNKGAKFDAATSRFLNDRFSNDGAGYKYNFVLDPNTSGRNVAFINTNWTDSTGANKTPEGAK